MKKSLLILYIFLGLTAVNAQKQLSLSDAIRIGLENNYDLRLIRYQEDIAGINNTWGNTSIMPSVDFVLSAQEDMTVNPDTLDYRTQTIYPELSLSWVVFNGFSARITKQKYEELEQQSQGNTAVLVESTIQDIILAYNNCLLQNELVNVYKELADLSEDRYNRTLNSKELGVGTTYESLQAKTSWLEDQSNYLEQKITFDNAVRTLNYTLAVEDNSNWEFTTELLVEAPDYTMEDLSSKLLQNNTTLKNQYIYQSLQAKETALAKSDFYPTISINAGLSNTNLKYTYEDPYPAYNTDFSDAYVGLTLSWNLFNGGIKKRSLQIARINEESAQVETEQMKHSLNNQLLQMYNSFIMQKTLLDIAMEKESAAKLNLDLSAEKYKNGTINSFNYRDVQIAYMNAAISRLSAIYNVIQSNTDLLRITGGIVDEYEAGTNN